MANIVICYIYKAIAARLRSGLFMLSGLNVARNCEVNELNNILWDFLAALWVALGGATASFPRRSFKMCDILLPCNPGQSSVSEKFLVMHGCYVSKHWIWWSIWYWILNNWPTYDLQKISLWVVGQLITLKQGSRGDWLIRLVRLFEIKHFAYEANVPYTD